MTAERPFSWTYAIGDVHGRLDLLEKAIAIMRDHGRSSRTRTVFLGDYVDRGPASRGVVERLIALQAEDPAVVCLKGNHEAMMLGALTTANPAQMRHWRANGGDETLRSYGVETWAQAGRAVPGDHLAWMAGLPLTTADDHRIYVHAGLAPNTPLAPPTEETCLWIREAFLRAKASRFKTHVVHGHTPYWAGKTDPTLPELLSHRTNLDTGAFATGILTIGVFRPSVAGGPAEILRAESEGLPKRATADAAWRDPVRRPRQ